jgi:hypothetical protein
MILTNTSYLTTLSSGAGGLAAGDQIYETEIHPALIEVPWLKKFAACYERWRLRALAFVYTPIAAATTAGVVIGYPEVDVDHDDDINEGEWSVRDAFAHKGSSSTTVYSPHCWVFPIDKTQDWKYMNILTNEARWCLAGKFYFEAGSDIAANTQLGTLQVVYELEFDYPDEADAQEGRWAAMHGGGTMSYRSPVGTAPTVIELDDIDGNPIKQSFKIRSDYTISDSPPYQVLSVPRGNYLCCYTIIGTLLTAGQEYVKGDYSYCTEGGSDYTYVLVNSATQTSGAFVFTSCGYIDNSVNTFSTASGLCFVANSNATITACSIHISSIPGAPIYIDPFVTKTRALKRENLRINSTLSELWDVVRQLREERERSESGDRPTQKSIMPSDIARTLVEFDPDDVESVERRLAELRGKSPVACTRIKLA